MQNSFYAKRQGPVKADYTIRFGGATLRVRATHMELLKFLQAVFGKRRAA